MAAEEKGNAAPPSASVTTVACKCQYLERVDYGPEFGLRPRFEGKYLGPPKG